MTTYSLVEADLVVILTHTSMKNSRKNLKMSKYTLLPCFTCSHWDLVSCFISLVRFPLGYFPEFKLPPFVVFPLFFDVLPHPNEGHLCLSNDLHPPCTFQSCLLNCCISECRSNCHSLNFDLLDVWFLDSRRLVDY